MSKIDEGLSWLLIQSPTDSKIPRAKLRDIYEDLQEMCLKDDEIQEVLKRYYEDDTTGFLVAKLIRAKVI